mmetsp:Transcript_70514/g.117082  ORF Transcript_70514/g.117082 Transcript_70514/m.117082 type:complete len:292 (-) Transcript_70514:634-1509(-)
MRLIAFLCRIRSIHREPIIGKHIKPWCEEARITIEVEHLLDEQRKFARKADAITRSHFRHRSDKSIELCFINSSPICDLLGIHILHGVKHLCQIGSKSRHIDVLFGEAHSCERKRNTLHVPRRECLNEIYHCLSSRLWYATDNAEIDEGDTSISKYQQVARMHVCMEPLIGQHTEHPSIQGDDERKLGLGRDTPHRIEIGERSAIESLKGEHPRARCVRVDKRRRHSARELGRTSEEVSKLHGALCLEFEIRLLQDGGTKRAYDLTQLSCAQANKLEHSRNTIEQIQIRLQ